MIFGYFQIAPSHFIAIAQLSNVVLSPFSFMLGMKDLCKKHLEGLSSSVAYSFSKLILRMLNPDAVS